MRGLTQAQLAERLGVDRMTIRNWETRKLPPQRRMVDAILRCLGDEVAYARNEP